MRKEKTDKVADNRNEATTNTQEEEDGIDNVFNSVIFQHSTSINLKHM